MNSIELIKLLGEENIEVLIGTVMHPETSRIAQLENRNGKLIICANKKPNPYVSLWNNGYADGRRSGFIAGKWAGYTQAINEVLNLVPGGTLKKSIQSLLDKTQS